MIQRIQSLYLLLTIIISLLFLTGDFIRFRTSDGSEFQLTSMAIFDGIGNENLHREGPIPLSAVSFLVPLVFTVSLFLYRKRKLQMKMITTGIILVLLMIILILPPSLEIMEKNDAVPMPGFRLALLPLMILFPLMARRRVRSDERLVSSFDRIR